jgi:tetratricopeptide (TPR) repeat protein
LWIVMLGLVLAGGNLAAEVDAKQIAKAAKQAQRGTEALDEGRAAQARTYFEKALKLVPPYPEAHAGLGHLAMQDEDFEAALWEYGLARDGYAELAENLYDVEMQRYYRAQTLVPGLQQELILLQTGEQRMTESDRRWRVTELEQQIRDLENLQPPRKEAMHEPPARMDFFVGNALSRLRRWEEAIEEYEACIHKQPGFAAVYNNLAFAYWRHGRPQDALASLEQAEELGVRVNPRFKADVERSLREAGSDPSR